MPESITSSSIRSLSTHGHDSPLEGPSLSQLGPHGSCGFSPVGETVCTLRGNRCMSSRKKGRRTAGTPDGACGHPERELPARPLHGFLATRSGERRFSSGKICARVHGPQNGRLHCAGAPESLVSSTQNGYPLPSTGLGRWGYMPQRTNCGKGEKQERAKKLKKKQQQKEKAPKKSSSNNLFLFGILE